MKNKLLSPAIVFIIGFLTMGLGNTVSIYIITDCISFDKDGAALYPMREAVLNFITFGIYGILWTYKTARTVCAETEGKNKGFTVLITVLSVFPTRCISMALIANKMLLSEKY